MKKNETYFIMDELPENRIEVTQISEGVTMKTVMLTKTEADYIIDKLAGRLQTMIRTSENRPWQFSRMPYSNPFIKQFAKQDPFSELREETLAEYLERHNGKE